MPTPINTPQAAVAAKLRELPAESTRTRDISLNYMLTSLEEAKAYADSTPNEKNIIYTPNLKVRIQGGTGMCGTVERIYGTVLRGMLPLKDYYTTLNASEILDVVFPAWEGRSGSEAYPVPAPKGYTYSRADRRPYTDMIDPKSRAFLAFDEKSGDHSAMWGTDHEYGISRRALLQFCTECLLLAVSSVELPPVPTTPGAQQ